MKSFSRRYVPPGEGFRKDDPLKGYRNFAVTWHWGSPGEIFVTRIDRSTYGCVKVVHRIPVAGMDRAEAEVRGNEVALIHGLLTPFAVLRSRFSKAKGWPPR